MTWKQTGWSRCSSLHRCTKGPLQVPNNNVSLLVVQEMPAENISYICCWVLDFQLPLPYPHIKYFFLHARILNSSACMQSLSDVIFKMWMKWIPSEISDLTTGLIGKTWLSQLLHTLIISYSWFLKLVIFLLSYQKKKIHCFWDPYWRSELRLLSLPSKLISEKMKTKELCSKLNR